MELYFWTQLIKKGSHSFPRPEEWRRYPPIHCPSQKFGSHMRSTLLHFPHLLHMQRICPMVLPEYPSWSSMMAPTHALTSYVSSLMYPIYFVEFGIFPISAIKKPKQKFSYFKMYFNIHLL